MPENHLDTSAVQRPGAFFGPITQTVRRIAAERFARAPEGRTLDVGCGNGLFFASLPQPAGRLVGLDLDQALLCEARQIFASNAIGEIDLVRGDLVRLPFLDKTFDKILFLNTLINIPSDAVVHALLCELMRVCRPSGHIFLDIRNAGNPVLRVRYWWHNRRADFVTRGHHLRHLRGLFASKGFHIAHQRPVGPGFPLLALGYMLEVRAPG